MSGDIETNPGPISSIMQSLSICHWNLNSISTDNIIKIMLLQAYLTTHSFDIVCLLETYLESAILNDDSRLSLHGYTLIRADRRSHIKSGVCIFYKNHLPLIRKLGMSSLDECLVCELNVGRKKRLIRTLHRSPSQSIEELINFKSNFEQTIININNNNISTSIFIGDFNARKANWWGNDKDNAQGLDLDEITCHREICNK